MHRTLMIEAVTSLWMFPEPHSAPFLCRVLALRLWRLRGSAFARRPQVPLQEIHWCATSRGGRGRSPKSKLFFARTWCSSWLTKDGAHRKRLPVRMSCTSNINAAAPTLLPDGICRAWLLDGSAARLKKPCASEDDATPPRGRIGPATSAARFGNT